MTRTQRTLDLHPLCKHPDPHDKNRETDIVEANATKPCSPGGSPTGTCSVRTTRDVSRRPSASPERTTLHDHDDASIK